MIIAIIGVLLTAYLGGAAFFFYLMLLKDMWGDTSLRLKIVASIFWLPLLLLAYMCSMIERAQWERIRRNDGQDF